MEKELFKMGLGVNLILDKMKYIGFFKEYDFKITIDSVEDLKQFNIENIDDIRLRENLINYLESGQMVFGWMNYVEDFWTKNPAVPHGYLTDGNWVWPTYYPYYLRKFPNYPINDEFVKHFVNAPQNKKILNSDLLKIEKELSSRL
jgi:hypothetical protein